MNAPVTLPAAIFTASNGVVFLGRLPLSATMVDDLAGFFSDALSFAAVTADEVTAKASRELGFALDDAESEALRQRKSAQTLTKQSGMNP